MKSFLERTAMAVAIMKGVEPKNVGRQAKAVLIESEDNSFETEFADVAVGDVVLMDGAPVEDGSKDGSYTITTEGLLDIEGNTIPVGSTITVTDNAISSIEMAEADSGEGGEPEAKEGAEKTVEELKAELEAKDKELTDTKAELATTKEDAEAAAKEIEQAAELMSNAKMPRAKATFKPPVEEDNRSMKEKIADRNKELNEEK